MSRMCQQVFIDGPLPSANDIIRKHWRVYSKFKKDWGILTKVAVRRHGLQPMQAQEPIRRVMIAFEWIEATDRLDRDRDPDNIAFSAKFILDALVQEKILRDDSRREIHSLHHIFAMDSVTPGVMVTLTELDEPQQNQEG